MPRVHTYVNKSGVYIKSAPGGKITTHQVTPEGQEWLKEWGLGCGGDLSQSRLRWLQDRGLAFTHGGGPGDIEDVERSMAGIRWEDSSPPRESRPARELKAQRSWLSEDTRQVEPLSLHPAVPNWAPSTPSTHSTSGDLFPWELKAFLAVAIGLSFGGSLILIVIYARILLIAAMLFLPFGLMSAFLSSSKSRSLLEGFCWGQLAGPVGLIIVTFLPAVDAPKATVAESAAVDRMNEASPTGRADDTAKVVMGTLFGILLIVLVFLAAIAIANAYYPDSPHPTEAGSNEFVGVIPAGSI